MMGTDWFEELFSLMKKRGVDFSGIETTVEVNPASIDLKKAKILKDLGVNRLSVGIQSCDDKVLSVIGREYDRKYLKALLPGLRALFDNLSFDIIYGIGEVERDIGEELQFLFNLAVPDHISAYAYTKPLHNRAVPTSSEERVVEEESALKDFLVNYKLLQYEVSNYAKEGFQCRHNLTYWSFETYLGIGSSAHSFFPKNSERFYYDDDVIGFINRPNPIRTRFEKDEAVKDFVMMSIRKREGINLKRFNSLFGFEFEGMLDTSLLKEWQTKKFILITDEIFKVTEHGYSYLSDITVALFEKIDKYLYDQ